MTATLYTIVDRSSGEVIDAGQTASTAAAYVLTDGGCDYELRREPDGQGWRIWSRQQVANRPWTSTRYYSPAESEADAWAELALEVIGRDAYAPGARGPDVVTDAQWRDSLCERIAETFSDKLREYLGDAIMFTIRAMNASPAQSPDVCASHNFCDANVFMAEAMAAHGIDSDPCPDDDAAKDRLAPLWNRAWDIARAKHF